MFRTAHYCPNVFNALLAFAFALSIGASCGYSQPNRQQIQWFEDLNSAAQYANTNNLPLMLHFYGDNCPPCRLLERKTYQNGELIGKINSSMVAVRINGEKDKELRIRYEITRWPTDVYLLPNGTEIYRTTSPQDPSVYGKMIDRIALRHRDWDVEQKAAQKAEERRIANLPTTQRAAEQPPHLSQINANSHATVTSRAPSVSPLAPSPQTVTFPQSDSQSSPAAHVVATSDSPGQLPRVVVKGEGSHAPDSNVPQVISVAQSFASQEHGATYENGTSHEMLHSHAHSGVPAMVVSHPSSLAANATPGAHSAPVVNSPALKSISGEATVGLDGYCPVSLMLGVKGETDPATCWTEGSPKFAVKHRGRIYLCASEELRQRFLQAPDLYSPCLSGFDLIHYIQTQEFVDGKCEFGCFQGDTGRVFLFSNRENYNEFVQKEAYYSQLVNGGSQPERVASQPDGTSIR